MIGLLAIMAGAGIIVGAGMIAARIPEYWGVLRSISAVMGLMSGTAGSLAIIGYLVGLYYGS